MEHELSRSQLVELLTRVLEQDGTERERHQWREVIRQHVPHPLLDQFILHSTGDRDDIPDLAPRHSSYARTAAACLQRMLSYLPILHGTAPGPTEGPDSGPDDILEDVLVFTGGLAMLDDFETTGRTGRRQHDTHENVVLTRAEASHGVVKAVSVTRIVACTSCRGLGGMDGSARQRCKVCDGSGRIRTRNGGATLVLHCEECLGRGEQFVWKCRACQGECRAERSETLRVRLPAGLGDGHWVRLNCRGNYMREMMAVGDLYLVIEVGDGA